MKMEWWCWVLGAGLLVVSIAVVAFGLWISGTLTSYCVDRGPWERSYSQDWVVAVLQGIMAWMVIATIGMGSGLLYLGAEYLTKIVCKFVLVRG